MCFIKVLRVNAAGTPEVQLKQIELPPIEPVLDDELDKKLAEQMNKLEIINEEKSWRDVEVVQNPTASSAVASTNVANENPDEVVSNVSYSSLRTSDLTIKAFVNVRTINHPSEFIVIF